MVTPQLIDYITSQLNRGISPEALTQSLLATGWASVDIQNALLAAQHQNPPVASAQAQSTNIWSYIILFLVGCVLTVLGFLPAVLWIVLKGGAHKMRKFIVLITGVIISVFFWWLVASIALGESSVSTSMSRTNAIELRPVRDALEQKFVGSKIRFKDEHYATPIRLDNTSVSSILTAEIVTQNKLLSAEERITAGKQVCNTLQENHILYDIVQISSVRESNTGIFTSSMSSGEGATCAEWSSHR